MSVILSFKLDAEITVRFIETCFDEAEPPHKCIMYVEEAMLMIQPSYFLKIIHPLEYALLPKNMNRLIVFRYKYLSEVSVFWF